MTVTKIDEGTYPLPPCQPLKGVDATAVAQQWLNELEAQAGQPDASGVASLFLVDGASDGPGARLRTRLTLRLRSQAGGATVRR